MLSEMQSQMQKLMMKIRQQDELIQELSNAKRVEVEALQLQEAPTPQHPVASPSLFNLSHTEPSPVNPSWPVQSKSAIPLPISIATPKASSPNAALLVYPVRIANSWWSDASGTSTKLDGSGYAECTSSGSE